MKIKTTVATLSILSILSFGAFAAEPISAEQAQNREAIGSVSVSAIGSSPMDMNAMLSKKADEQGATLPKRVAAATGTPLPNCTNKIHLPSHITCRYFAEISHKKSPLIREVDPIKE